MKKIVKKSNRTNEKKHRLIALLNLLIKQTDEDHPLKFSEISQILLNDKIKMHNRKTLYSDIKALEHCGYSVEYVKKGYFIDECPFNLSEVKFIIDAINNYKFIDNKSISIIKNKLYKFLSVYDEKILKKLEFIKNKNKNKNLLKQIEIILRAIKEDRFLKIVRYKQNEKVVDTIIAAFLHIDNNQYYLSYYYPDKDKRYNIKLSNLESISLLNKHSYIIDHSLIMKQINNSINSLSKGDKKSIKLEIINNYDEILKRLEDDFVYITISNSNIVYIDSYVNEQLFAKLLGYDTNIKIVDTSVKNQFKKYVKKILNLY